jgi:hypothetical protein
VWSEDEQLALEIISTLEDTRLKKKIEKMLINSEPRVPRPFFWSAEDNRGYSDY